MPRTAFNPQVHGFAFANSWEFEGEERTHLRRVSARYLPLGIVFGAMLCGPVGVILIPLGVVGVVTFGLVGALLIPLGIVMARRLLERHLAPGYGLCGGMCFAALDFFHANHPPPRGENANDQPAPGTRLRSYIWRRQLRSLFSDGARFMVWLISLNYAPQAWPFLGGGGWLLARSRKEWQKLKVSVDGGRPVPIGLVRAAKRVYDNHQVLAIGYEETGEAHGTIYVYDPNCPDRESTIDIQFGPQTFDGQESCGGGPPLRGFFCEAYRPSDPMGAVE